MGGDQDVLIPLRPRSFMHSVSYRAGSDIVGTIALLWKRRLVILLGMLVGSIAGVSYGLLATPWYKAEVVMLPAATRTANAGLSQLGGLASLAGINLVNPGSSTEALAVFRSREFARTFIESHQLIPVLFAAKWDSTKNQWKAGTVDKQPDMSDALEFFEKKIFSVTEDKRTGEIVLSILWTDRTQAAEWANALVTRINEQMRGQALEESTHNIQYLQAEIAMSNVAALQQSLGRVLESEMQKLLMARGSAEFAFKVVDRATAPKKRVSPQRALISLAGFLAGAALAVMAVLSVELLGPGIRSNT